MPSSANNSRLKNQGCGALLQSLGNWRRPLLKRENRQEAVWRKKVQAERQARRETYLRARAADFDPCWQGADKLAERGVASAYDEAKRALVDLSDVYALCAARADFDQKRVLTVM